MNINIKIVYNNHSRRYNATYCSDRKDGEYVSGDTGIICFFHVLPCCHNVLGHVRAAAKLKKDLIL